MAELQNKTNREPGMEGAGNYSIVVCIPCYNEAATITKVVSDFKRELPHASIHVFDNNSTDGSGDLAQKAGAVVHHVNRQGKGYVMRAILDAVCADAVVIVDGDDTYIAEEASKLLAPVLEGSAEMAVGNRLAHATGESLTRLHQIGNNFIVASINRLFGSCCQDILSGYRVLSRHLIESVPLLGAGFETETELTIRTLAQDLRIVELPISYRKRPACSHSKLRTFADGYRIMRMALILLRDLYPLRLFGSAGLVFSAIVVIAGALRIFTYFRILTLPTTLLTGLILLFAPLAFLAIGLGLSLDAINARFRDLRQILGRTRRLP